MQVLKDLKIADNFPPLPRILDGLDTVGVSIDQSQFINMFTKRSIDFMEDVQNQIKINHF